MLNDDIMITDKFMDDVINTIRSNNGRSLTINKSWSHFVINREEIDQVGYFDERLLGIGEEDGDIVWRYINRYGSSVANYKIKSFVNYAEDTVYTYAPPNIKCHSYSKYSLFNRNFINKKYRENSSGVKGMSDKPMELIDPGPEQYPNEKFYRLHKSKL
jgi:predicted glycosyltransferase involved in capsule biosynthesis